MISDRPFPTAVSVRLVDGRKINGRIAQFTPYVPDLTIEADEESSDGRVVARRVVVRGEQVAYIAFRTALGGASPHRPSLGIRRYKIHVIGGRVVTAEAVESQASNHLGFYAYPVDGDWEVREYFFYVHGVRRRELDEPIGEMLISEGIVAQETVQTGLKLQEAERKKSLSQILLEHNKVSPDRLEEAISMQQRRRLRLGDLLVEEGLATAEDIEAAMAEQRLRKGRRFGEILLEMNIIREEDLMRVLSKKFDLPFVDLDEHPVQPAAFTQVPRTIVENLGVMPIYADALHLIIAIADPLAFQAADLLRKHAKKRIVEVLVAPTQLKRYVDAALESTDEGASSSSLDDVDTILQQLAVDESVRSQDDKVEECEVAESDSGVIRLVNRVLIDAYKAGASDIHIEPEGRERPLRIRFRVDGVCAHYKEIPSEYRQAVVARLKIMANLDISERRKPQDGKIRFKFGDRTIELRVATLPTVNDNEDIVMRILAASKPIPIEKMGMSLRNLLELQRSIAKPYGLILCVGPTGSGKTTTLHSALGAINTGERKIWTAEDPVEITQRGLRQVQVHAKIGYTFAAAMRAFLRADPDVIMVGEMRDMETAGTAVEASLTGHLVFSTLHTNSAPETITRLLDMGLDPFSFADALIAVLAQRLARSLCSKCKRPELVTKEQYDEIVETYGPEQFHKNLGKTFGRESRLFRADGCETCNGTGYKGRAALHELLVANDEIKRAVARKSEISTIRELAIRGGMTTLVQDGVEKVIAGLTSMKQVFAVCAK